MSITLMAAVWPLEMAPSDKLVLLALADAANDEEGHTWIPLVSKVRLNRAGRPKLNLCVKTSLAKRTVQMAIARLVDAGHITREEKSGIGVNYWVHPVTDPSPSTGAADAPVQEMPGASDSPRGAADAGEGRTSCTQTLNNHQEPSAGARASRASRPPAVPVGGTATAAAAGPWMDAVREKAEEREGELRVRGVLEGEFGPEEWLQRCGIRCARLDDQGQAFGVTIFAAPAFRGRIEAQRNRLMLLAAEALEARVSWFHVMDGRLR